MSAALDLIAPDMERAAEISARITGYSGATHYGFFKWLLGQPQVKNILVLGVYHGRDIAFMQDVQARYYAGRKIWITGVDKFSDTPCADWPEGTEKKNWAQAGFGTPPSLDATFKNTYSPHCRIVPENDESFLNDTEDKFDAVYLDTAHDYETVTRQCRQMRRVCNPGAIICGDDYSDQGTWGVKKAVAAAFREHCVFGDWIWYSNLSLLNYP